jgi:hypothetical protein
MKNLYGSLALGDCATALPDLRQRIAALASYRKTALPPLADDEKHRVVNAWSRNFLEWGYDVEDSAERAA